MELKLKDRRPRTAVNGKKSARGKTARQGDGPAVKARPARRLPEALLAFDGLGTGEAGREDRVENVTDSEHQTAYGYNQRPRSVFVGLNWKSSP